MTSITPALRATPVYTYSPPPTNRGSGQITAAADTPSSSVLLGQDTRVSDSQTYSSRGSLDGQTRYFWEQSSEDKLGLALLGSIRGTATSTRFQGLGAALLNQLASNGGQNISQSVFARSDGIEPSSEALKLQQTRLREDPANGVSLTLTAASGAKINLIIASDERGIAVSAEVTDGQLTEDELKGLAGLANSFQSTINGLTEQPPRLKLDGLAKLDPALFSGLQMKAKFDVGGQAQRFELNLNDKTRSVSLQGPSGNLQLNLDVSNSDLIGSASQRQAAIANYLAQFDAAQRRGKGDDTLMSTFKDAFTQLNSVETKPKPVIQLGGGVTDNDRALLSGLADFSASISQATRQSNPLRADELERFDYKVSQSTDIRGDGPLNRSVQQEAKSSLKASYYEGLNPLVDLRLGYDSKSQNYRYHEIDDQASSSTRLTYSDGRLAEASATQHATSSHRVRTYIDGVLKDDVNTPKEVVRARDLRSLLNKVFQEERQAQREQRGSILDQALAAHREQWLLQSDPALIAA